MFPSSRSLSRIVFFSSVPKAGGNATKRALLPVILVLTTGLLLLSQIAYSQSRPKVTGVDPAMGKADDTVTLTGENLTKDLVAGVFLSDDTEDHKATITDQAADKIVIKVPSVKAGNYNISIQEGEQILILPVRFTVQ